MIAKSTMNRRVVGLIVPLVILLGIAFVSLPVRGQAAKEERKGIEAAAAIAPADVSDDVLDITLRGPSGIDGLVAAVKHRAATGSPKIDHESTALQ
jgi:hypothetical protein